MLLLVLILSRLYRVGIAFLELMEEGEHLGHEKVKEEQRKSFRLNQIVEEKFGEQNFRVLRETKILICRVCRTFFWM